MSTVTDAEILRWLEDNHTLHYSVEAIYVVDGFEVSVVYDGNEVPNGGPWFGKTLREAYSLAASEWNKP